MRKRNTVFFVIGMTLVILTGIAVTCADAEIRGVVAAIEATIDYKASTNEDDLSVDQAYLAAWYGNTDGYFYFHAEETKKEVIWTNSLTAESDTTWEKTQKIVVDEVYGKLYFYDLDWRIGKVILPFGFDYLSRPESSVFITAPKEDFYDFGLHLGAEYSIFSLDGSYLGKGDYSIRGAVSLFNGKNTTSFSVNNVPELKERYGRFSITNMFKYGSTLFDLSSLTEYNPDNGDFWTRLVIAPGIFDSIGIFGGYYHLKEMYNGLHNFDHTPDSWTYGGFVDLSPNMHVSIEWMDSNVLNPLTFQIVIIF